MNKQEQEEQGQDDDFAEYEFSLWEVLPQDVLALEQFADAVLRDDFFFRKGHWLSLLNDSRCRVLVVRARPPGAVHYGELIGVVVLYADSILHNLFLSRQWRSLGVGSAVIESVAPSAIRAKTDMSTGDPTDFYARLGFTHESEKAGKRGQIRVLTRPADSTRAKNLKSKKKDEPNPSEGG